jgi:uncharacterized membrane protein YoaK (UPF0700 family)
MATGCTVPMIRPGAVELPANRRRNDAVTLLLALTAASVDVVVFSSFGALAAAQSGNTILLGVALGKGHGHPGVAAAASALVGHVAGVSIAERIIEARRPLTRRVHPVAEALIVELLLLVGVLVAWRDVTVEGTTVSEVALVTAAAMAMGIQSVAVTCMHAGPSTTYISATLATFFIRSVRTLSWAGPQAVASRRGSSGGGQTWLFGATWAAYLVGAVITALLYGSAGAKALVLPIALLAAATLAACARQPHY